MVVQFAGREAWKERWVDGKVVDDLSLFLCVCVCGTGRAYMPSTYEALQIAGDVLLQRSLSTGQSTAAWGRGCRQYAS